MNDLRDAIAIAMKKEREKVLAQPLARIWPDLSAAALRAIEDAGYALVPGSASAIWGGSAPSPGRSYADQADGATTFDPDDQFEKDRDAEMKP